MRAVSWRDYAVAGQSNARGNNGDSIAGTALPLMRWKDQDAGASTNLSFAQVPPWWSEAAASAPRVGVASGIAAHYGASSSIGVRICQDSVGGSAIATWISTYADRHIASMSATGWTFRGLIWVQGEEDAKSASASASYQTSLGTLFGKYRTTFPNLPICIVKLAGDFTPLSGSADYIDEIRAAQEAYAASDSLCAIIDADEYDGLQHDGVHRTGPQQLVIGARAVAAIEALQ